MSEHPFTIELNSGVALLEWERPPVNFFDLEVITAIATAVQELGENAACRAIVLASRGRCFCAGADFNSSNRVDPAEIYRAALPIFRRRKPLIAAVQGPAVGGGLGLALAADFRVVAPEARFHANFVQIGLHPGFALTYTLPRVIGAQAAHAMLLTGRRVGGEEALRLGLADKLVSLEQLRAGTLELAAAIATNAPLAITSIQAALTPNLAELVEQAMARELAEQRKLLATEDFREGVRAQADRRAPQFVGR